MLMINTPKLNSPPTSAEQQIWLEQDITGCKSAWWFSIDEQLFAGLVFLSAVVRRDRVELVGANVIPARSGPDVGERLTEIEAPSKWVGLRRAQTGPALVLQRSEHVTTTYGLPCPERRSIE